MANTGDKAVAATQSDAEVRKQKFLNRMADSHNQLSDLMLDIIEHLGPGIMSLDEALYSRLMGVSHNATHVESAATEFVTKQQ